MAENLTKTSSPTSSPHPVPPAPQAQHRPQLHDHDDEKERRHPWVWAVVILIVIGIGVLAYLRKQKPPAKPPPPVVIAVTNAMSGDINNTVTGLGTVTPVYTAAISSRVDGQVLSVNYVEGQLVKTNDLLVQVDPQPYQAAVIQGEGQLAHDRATLAKDQNDLERYRAAYLKNAIPKMTFDDQVQTVRQDEGTVKSDEGLVSNSLVNLNYCSIRAPISGRVGLRLIDPGNVVHAANTNALVVVTELQPITVIFTVAENFLPEIEEQTQMGNKMTVEAWDPDWGRKIADGTFLTTDNMVDVSTGTIRIKAIFPNEDFSLFPNYFVNAKLIVDTLHNVTLVPTAAIQRNPQGAFVYVVGPDQKVTMQTITTGIAENDLTQVGGIDPGTTIATDNFNKLGDNMKVTVRKPGKGHSGGKAPSDGKAPANAKKHHKKDTDKTTSGQGQDSDS